MSRDKRVRHGLMTFEGWEAPQMIHIHRISLRNLS